MARRIVKLKIECLNCKNHLTVDSETIEDHIGEELSLLNIGHVYKLLVCRKCSSKAVRIWDDRNSIILDSSDIKLCSSCGYPLPMPRRTADPFVTLCANCSGVRVTPNVPDKTAKTKVIRPKSNGPVASKRPLVATAKESIKLERCVILRYRIQNLKNEREVLKSKHENGIIAYLQYEREFLILETEILRIEKIYHDIGCSNLPNCGKTEET